MPNNMPKHDEKKCYKCGGIMVLDEVSSDEGCEVWACIDCDEVDVDPIVPDIPDEYEEQCEYCGRYMGCDDGDYCPYCCPNQGAYAAGTEECDWCPSGDECSHLYRQRMTSIGGAS